MNSTHPVIENLCKSCLDETCFHLAITIQEEGRPPVTVSAWEVTQSQLREIWENARHSDVRLDQFQVAVRRSRTKETFRWAKTNEWKAGHTTRNQMDAKLKQLIARKTR